MRHELNCQRFGAVLFATFMVATSSVMGDDSNVSQGAKARYDAAIRIAEQRFTKNVEAARKQFLADVKAARQVLEDNASSLDNLPVAVPGTDAGRLVEGSGKEGWFEIPEEAAGSVIFTTGKDQPKDGVLQFQVTRDGPVGLAASWAYDGNPGGDWQAERKTKKDLTESGWRQVGHMYRNLFDRHTIFIRQCKKGESFRIRTRKYHRPYVLIQDVFARSPKPMAPPKIEPGVVVEVVASTSQPVAEILPPEDTPEVLAKTTAYVSPLSGVAIVRVHRRCLMYVAASWDYDGNNSGQWTEERWSKQKFRDEGWKEVDTLKIKHRGSDQEHTLFSKECDKGERFRLRTRKYGAPVVFAPTTE